MTDQFKRILELVRRTGDRMVVTDPDGNDAFVVMDLESYESLLDFTEDDGFDVEDLPDEFFAPPEGDAPASSPADIWEAMKPADGEGETWDLTKMDADERQALEEQFAAFQAQKEQKQEKTAEVSEKETKNRQEEEDEDFGEEQFYLEPID